MSNTFYIIGIFVSLVGITIAIGFPLYLSKKLKKKYGDIPDNLEEIIHARKFPFEVGISISKVKRIRNDRTSLPSEWSFRKNIIYGVAQIEEPFPNEECVLNG